MRAKSGCVIQPVCLLADSDPMLHTVKGFLMIICTAAMKKKKERVSATSSTKRRRMIVFERDACPKEKTLQRQAELRRFLFVTCWLKCNESVAGD